MSIGNWQIKILTLCMAAFALCLTAACGESYPDEEPVIKRIMPMGSCPNDINEAPDNPELTYKQEVELKFERAGEVLNKYHSLLTGRDDTSQVSLGYFSSEDRIFPYRADSYTVFIDIWFVTNDVDQSKLPPEERIPHCLEGVPVHFLTNQPYPTIGN